MFLSIVLFFLNIKSLLLLLMCYFYLLCLSLYYHLCCDYAYDLCMYVCKHSYIYADLLFVLYMYVEPGAALLKNSKDLMFYVCIKITLLYLL